MANECVEFNVVCEFPLVVLDVVVIRVASLPPIERSSVSIIDKCVKLELLVVMADAGIGGGAGDNTISFRSFFESDCNFWSIISKSSVPCYVHGMCKNKTTSTDFRSNDLFSPSLFAAAGAYASSSRSLAFLLFNCTLILSHAVYVVCTIDCGH